MVNERKLNNIQINTPCGSTSNKQTLIDGQSVRVFFMSISGVFLASLQLKPAFTTEFRISNDGIAALWTHRPI